jgi:hypothetical protein
VAGFCYRGGGIFHDNILFIHIRSRVPFLQQTATSFAALFRLRVEGELIKHFAAKRLFKTQFAGVTVATLLRFIAKV